MNANSKRSDRVVFVETNKSQREVCDLFSRCGRIWSMYPCDAHRDDAGWFVEYCDQTSARNACMLQTSDTKVHILAFSPQLQAQFTAVAWPLPSSSSVRKNKQDYMEGATPPPPPKRPRYDYRNRSDPRSGRQSNGGNRGRWGSRSSPSIRSSPMSVSPLSHKGDNANCSFSFRVPTLSRTDSDKENQRSAFPQPHEARSRFQPMSHTAALRGDSPHSASASTAMTSQHVKTESSDASVSLPIPSCPPRSRDACPPEGVTLALQPKQNLPCSEGPSRSPPLILSYQGKRANCDLGSLKEDPEGVITVLKATASDSLERDKWMIVASYYRSKGNLKAALAVVSAMVEVMTSSVVGLESQALKPAYLMLASCHTDLGKQARLSPDVPEDVSKVHYERATEYLRRVYGVFASEAPPPPLAEPARIDVPRPSSPAPRAPKAPPERRTPTAPASVLRSPQSHLTPSRRPSSDPRIHMLERELHSLRDRHTNQTKHLASVRASIRSLEDALAGEQRLRRRAERELASAQRSENFALEQCRREVETRREAEAARDAARASAEEVRGCVERAKETERRARDCFGRLGILFMGAARGEMNSAMFGGGSGSVTPTAGFGAVLGMGPEGLQGGQGSVAGSVMAGGAIGGER
ncbi:hypothetical protein CERSUDRAFT_126972 [Gelatoporia subvermispora B]|uniref:RRM domain-containing protein n=1 Tax=Ceriporiopsis subvermispora (strain B) TaxID=914234 RepID=M2P9E8_CERS8|nr:hypothetical protein CERSUDRAFT_126972 [Gelatoporia subvermispora B]